MFHCDTGATLLVGQFDRLNFYCSYPSVTKSLDNPSLYCIVSGNTYSLLKTKISTHVYMHIQVMLATIMLSCGLFSSLSGAVFQYFVVNSILWWLFHICSVLYKLAFPVFSNRKRKYELIVHIMLTVVGEIPANAVCMLTSLLHVRTFSRLSVTSSWSNTINHTTRISVL